ncbi:hypothetical protein BV20DRAFT_39257 [Pilatotrama ljubarskyi]|nr:hypothetical protein BV20DRAFT_39257 [Pilatotrama ljubarskyi]
MLFTFAIAALALLGQAVDASVLATEATNVAASFPVVDITSAKAHPNITLGHGGIHADAAQAEFPATLLLCPTTSCISCFGFDLSATPTNLCLAAGFSYSSVAINQPSNEGLPFGVFIGPPGCASFLQIPAVNTCYNINGGTFSDYAVA